MIWLIHPKFPIPTGPPQNMLSYLAFFFFFYNLLNLISFVCLHMDVGSPLEQGLPTSSPTPKEK